ncbi:alpha/beta hydrolase [Segnochrobactraceae bacterium EtOH-i3]
MLARTARLVKRTTIVVAVIAITLLGVRAWDSLGGPPLEPWHIIVPEEMTIDEMDKASWTDYLAHEDAMFRTLRADLSADLEPEDKTDINRYFEGSPIFTGNFKQDWNRSYEIRPKGEVLGAVVLLHGLTDSPYSLRHIAEHYADRGFLAIGVRVPGHGTVPAALTEATWEDWMAAVRLAMREARAQAGPDRPVHMVGFSNGGALALKYSLDTLADPALPRADRLVLLSPMIGVTQFARFAGLAGIPAILPSFAKAAWLGIVPEFNPFKYNSFPVNGARQSFELTQELQGQISREAKAGTLEKLPPVLTFQSVLDFTVSTRAIITAFYSLLPQNGSELVLFDINRGSPFGGLFTRAADTALNAMLPAPPRRFRTVIVTNAQPGDPAVVARILEPGATEDRVLPLGVDYPADVFSLSHVALPFPVTDSLYGATPDPDDGDFGVHLGAIAARGERGALIVNLDSLLRTSFNPFFDQLIARIDREIDRSVGAVPGSETQPETAPPTPGSAPPAPATGG